MKRSLATLNRMFPDIECLRARVCACACLCYAYLCVCVCLCTCVRLCMRVCVWCACACGCVRVYVKRTIKAAAVFAKCFCFFLFLFVFAVAQDGLLVAIENCTHCSLLPAEKFPMLSLVCSTLFYPLCHNWYIKKNLFVLVLVFSVRIYESCINQELLNLCEFVSVKIPPLKRGIAPVPY